MTEWKVYKFGGTSLSDAERFHTAAALILEAAGEKTKLGVVVSAPGLYKSEHLEIEKVTSALFRCSTLASAHDPAYLACVEAIRQRMMNLIDSLFPVKGTEKHSKMIMEYNNELKEHISADFEDLLHILRACWLSRRFMGNEWWTGYGELWSARIMTFVLRFLGNKSSTSVVLLDARDVLVVDWKSIGPVPLYEQSRTNLQKNLIDQEPNAEIVVITGYLASLRDGTPCTLGRDGSDYSASIFGALLEASLITIWTDVDGIYSASPSTVRSAVIRPLMSYNEAMELAYFGAKVIHPKTMAPVMKYSIPIRIRNAFNPERAGTLICSPAHIEELGEIDYVIQGFSTINNLALVNVEGSGMIGVPGIAQRIFGAIRNSGSSVVLITQGGSEHSVCFALPLEQQVVAVEAVTKEFREELEQADVQSITVVKPVACLAAVGDRMEKSIGIASKVLVSLAQAKINVLAIAQGSSEKNLSLIIDQTDVPKALNSVHNSFVHQIPTFHFIVCVPVEISDLMIRWLHDVLGEIGEWSGICYESEKMILNPMAYKNDRWDQDDLMEFQSGVLLNEMEKLQSEPSNCVVYFDLCSSYKGALTLHSRIQTKGIQVIGLTETPEVKGLNLHEMYFDVKSQLNRLVETQQPITTVEICLPKAQDFMTSLMHGIPQRDHIKQHYTYLIDTMEKKIKIRFEKETSRGEEDVSSVERFQLSFVEKAKQALTITANVIPDQERTKKYIVMRLKQILKQ